MFEYSYLLSLLWNAELRCQCCTCKKPPVGLGVWCQLISSHKTAIQAAYDLRWLMVDPSKKTFITSLLNSVFNEQLAKFTGKQTWFSNLTWTTRQQRDLVGNLASLMDSIKVSNDSNKHTLVTSILVKMRISYNRALSQSSLSHCQSQKAASTVSRTITAYSMSFKIDVTGK